LRAAISRSAGRFPAADRGFRALPSDLVVSRLAGVFRAGCLGSMGDLPCARFGMAASHVACRRIPKTFRILAGSIGDDILLGLRDVSRGPARGVAHKNQPFLFASATT